MINTDIELLQSEIAALAKMLADEQAAHQRDTALHLASIERLGKECKRLQEEGLDMQEQRNAWRESHEAAKQKLQSAEDNRVFWRNAAETAKNRRRRAVYEAQQLKDRLTRLRAIIEHVGDEFAPQVLIDLMAILDETP